MIPDEQYITVGYLVIDVHAGHFHLLTSCWMRKRITWDRTRPHLLNSLRSPVRLPLAVRVGVRGSALVADCTSRWTTGGVSARLSMSRPDALARGGRVYVRGITPNRLPVGPDFHGRADCWLLTRLSLWDSSALRFPVPSPSGVRVAGRVRYRMLGDIIYGKSTRLPQKTT